METVFGNILSYNTRELGQDEQKITQNQEQKKKENTKFRWAFVDLNNQFLIKNYKDIAAELKKAKFDYYLAGWHRGEKNENGELKNDHIHIFVQYKNPREMGPGFLKRIYFAHLAEHKKFNPVGIIRYIKCDDKKHKEEGWTSEIIEEIGIAKGDGKFPTIEQVQNMANEEIKQLPIQYYNIANKIVDDKKNEVEFDKMLEEIEKDELKAPRVIYLTGASGNGKTYGAYKLALKNYKKEDIGKITINNNFFNITKKYAKCYVVEEFRDSQLKACDFLQFTDKYGYNANIKGGFQCLRPEMIIICSIIPAEEIYKNNNEINKQFRRRITEYYEIDANRNFNDISMRLNTNINEFTNDYNFRL